MNVFDIVGPVMVGPSSSHTAGAVRIGYLARRMMGEEIRQAVIGLHGSFLATGTGHGTDKALVAGLLGLMPDDLRIPDSFSLAEEAGLEFQFEPANLTGAHPNTVQLNLTGDSGESLEIVGSSLGGGRVSINGIDGLPVSFQGDFPTLVVHNEDKPGQVRDTAAMLSDYHVNIAALQLSRDVRGGYAVMVVECDQEIPVNGREWLKQRDGIWKVTYLSLEEEHGQIVR